MTKKLLFLWKELLATFWFVPVLIIVLSIFLSVGFVTLDTIISINQEGWIRFFLVNSSDSARSILSTIAGAMIGVAGTVFSVTLVALTLASSQFGPRLIKNFMYVRLNQVVLGSYISTYLYCLLVLNAVNDNEGYTFIPSLSILIAIVLAVVNIVLLILFIHQIAMSIQADRVISNISDVISEQVTNLFPQKNEEVISDTAFNPSTVKKAHSCVTEILAPREGYILYINIETLLEISKRDDLCLELNFRPGNFLVKNQVLSTVYCSKECSEEQIKELQNQFVLGKMKTSQQDLEFSIHQMVEIASRALSPGVNDPYTAIACIDNLTATMCYLAKTNFPSKFVVDDENTLRLMIKTLTFEGVLNAAFNQIRQFSVGSPSVMIRLVESLNTIDSFATKPVYKKAIRKHIEMIVRLGKKTINEKNDLLDLELRAAKTLSSN